ncbi:MAG: hypothetical protein EBZ47_07240 [Chlamydiae bacterium]|nr:hypothetical protein [Chlamydiota bacterium]
MIKKGASVWISLGFFLFLQYTYGSPLGNLTAPVTAVVDSRWIKTTVMGDGKDDKARAVAIQTDGKIILAGYSQDFIYGKRFALARYTTAGVLDADFGTFGRVITKIGNGREDEIFTLAIDGNGKIVVGGSSYDPIYGYQFALARYTTVGALDTVFGTNGKVVTTIGTAKSSRINALAIDGNGKIVVAGYSRNSDDDSRFALARYTTEGALDTTFGTNGKVVTTIENNKYDSIKALAIDGDGKIVVGGYSVVPAAGLYQFALARYTTTGSLDTTFGVNGKVLTRIRNTTYDIINALAIDGNNNIIVGGYSGFDELVNQIYSEVYKEDAQLLRERWVLARYTSAGVLDTTFGSHGKVVTRLENKTIGRIHALAVDANNKIIVAASSGNVVKGDKVDDYKFTVARYTTLGELDTTFGTDGKVITAVGNIKDIPKALAIRDGKIAVAGSSKEGDAFKFALARYTQANGTIDTL